LAYAPFDLWYVTPLAFSLFLYLLATCHLYSPFRLGLSFGLGWFGAGISWVHVSIADFGGLPLIGSLGLMVLLCTYLALYPALVSLALRRYFDLTFWPLALPGLWFVAEWLRGWMLTGFPWLSLGYSQLTSPLSGWLPVIGETGVSLLVVTLSACIALSLIQRKKWPPVLLTTVLLLSGYVLDQINWNTQVSKTPKITMLQGNIQQELRWVPEQDWPTMKKYLDMTELHWQSDIIIWPEAAIPKLEPLALDYIAHLDEQALENDTALVTGIVNYNFENQQAFNNLIALGKKYQDSDKVQYRYFHANRYAKHHLLPIGEFIPMESWLRGLAPIFDLPMSSFTRGDFQQTNLKANGYQIAAAICFEIAFPMQLRANLNKNTDYILTVSNDAWFGDSHGPDQHLQIAQVRAKEFAMPVLRATNNGITAFIDHKGKIISRAPQFAEASLTAEIPPRRGFTPYYLFGELFNALIVFALFGIALWLRKKPKSCA